MRVGLGITVRLRFLARWKVVETLISELSPDGKTWTLTISGVTPNGQPLNNVIVREKQ
jgi:hypothetical protein